MTSISVSDLGSAPLTLVNSKLNHSYFTSLTPHHVFQSNGHFCITRHYKYLSLVIRNPKQNPNPSFFLFLSSAIFDSLLCNYA